MVTESENGVGERLSALIERSHGGNVNLAASHLGIRQRTLADLVAGKVRVPRQAALTAIMKYYPGTTAGWLLFGEGPPPFILTEGQPPLLPSSVQWQLSMHRLEASETLKAALGRLPNVFSRAKEVIADADTIEQADGGAEAAIARSVAAFEATQAARNLSSEAWLRFLDAMMNIYGEDAVVRALESKVDAVRLGFNDFAFYLQQSGRISGSLAEEWEKRESTEKERYRPLSTGPRPDSSAQGGSPRSLKRSGGRGRKRAR